MTLKSFQIIFSTVCLLVLSFEAIAQSPSPQKSDRQVVEGVVVDQAGDPVAAATVTLSSAGFTTTSQTDNEGRFHLESMAEESL
ncbi:MAG: carboxypeptidase-like regulatory domain-containing protein, partial [bacterium]